VPLSPKSQWDRYGKLSKASAPAADVAARLPASAWRRVGSVASAAHALPLAAARQKRLIGEHACRLFPELTSRQRELEFGVGKGEGEWEVLAGLDKGEVAGVPADEVGFEGVEDPATGYYCLYKQGKLVSGSTEDKSKGSMDSKKVQGGSGWSVG
jgi:hypothetical protein